MVGWFGLYLDVLVAAALFLILLSAGVGFVVTYLDYSADALVELALMAARYSTLPCYCD